jgi:hypothetical protein
LKLCCISGACIIIGILTEQFLADSNRVLMLMLLHHAYTHTHVVSAFSAWKRTKNSFVITRHGNANLRLSALSSLQHCIAEQTTAENNEKELEASESSE